jgi:hypothetical protein
VLAVVRATLAVREDGSANRLRAAAVHIRSARWGWSAFVVLLAFLWWAFMLPWPGDAELRLSIVGMLLQLMASRTRAHGQTEALCKPSSIDVRESVRHQAPVDCMETDTTAGNAGTSPRGHADNLVIQKPNRCVRALPEPHNVAVLPCLPVSVERTIHGQTHDRRDVLLIYPRGTFGLPLSVVYASRDEHCANETDSPTDRWPSVRKPSLGRQCRPDNGFELCGRLCVALRVPRNRDTMGCIKMRMTRIIEVIKYVAATRVDNRYLEPLCVSRLPIRATAAAR